MKGRNFRLGKDLLIFFFLLLAILLGYFIFVPRQIGNFSEKVKTFIVTKEEFDFSQLQKTYQQAVSVKVWREHKNSLFTARPYIWKEGKLIDPLESSEKLHPPIPNWWLIKHRLEYWNPALLEMDLKGDGFTVLENYQTNTHPTDFHTHAPPHIKLRFKKSIYTPFRIKFSGTPDDGRTFALNIRDVPFEQTQFLLLGESIFIKDVPYILKNYQKKVHINEMGLEVDISELILEGNEDKITLYVDREADFPTFYALFQFFDEELKIKRGELFTLKRIKNYQYRLLHINEAEALIEVVATGEKYCVPKL